MRLEVTAATDGFISQIDTYRIGRLMVGLKAGRLKVADTIDPGIGLRMLAHAGSEVKAGVILNMAVIKLRIH